MSKMNTRLTFHSSLIIAIISLIYIAGVQAQDDNKNTLVDALQQGGYVVYMRHGDTTGEPLDRARDLTNRSLQRNLSEVGKIQSANIGDAIQRLKLKVGHIAASPVFRARDTAELAFGAERVEIDQWLTADDFVSGGYTEHILKLRGYLATPPQHGNTWLVGHVISIAMATSSEVSRRNFPEGAAAIFKPTGTEFELIGILDSGWEVLD